MLDIRHGLPEGFLGATARDLHRVLDGPTLIYLEGRREPPLFISALLHGNEDVGLLAVQRLLAEHAGQELPRSLVVFIGNVEAARHGVRRLAGEADYNRIWPGETGLTSPEARMAAELTERMRREGLFASVDVHNNTGLNPHYGCINRLEPEFLQLAALFGRTGVYFRYPRGVQSLAFADICPAITLECGKTGQEAGVDHAWEYLRACLHLSEIPDHPVADHDLSLYHTVARVTVPESVSFGFDDQDADISFLGEIDQLNFRHLPPDTLFARLNEQSGPCLRVLDEHGRDVSGRYFVCRDNELRSCRPFMPSMLTRDETIIRQDCLCYLMEQYDWREDREAAQATGTS